MSGSGLFFLLKAFFKKIDFGGKDSTVVTDPGTVTI
jgi:hypothetical protein